MKNIFLIVCLAASIQQVQAQQDVLLSQYMFNHLLVNPGYAGSKEYIMATLLYRNQWMNWDNAPKTEVATIHGPLGMTNLGWGGMISHDHEGVTDRTDFYANAAYHLKLNAKLKLGVGLRGGAAYYVRHNQELKYWNQDDPKFAGTDASSFLPNLGAGAFLYSRKFYFGVAVPEVLSYDPTKSLSIGSIADYKKPHQVQHFFVSSGVALEVSQDVVIKPSILMKYVGNAPVEADFNLNVLLSQLIWIGGSYRTGDAVVALIELKLTKQLTLGYSYDFTMTDVKNYSSGSHEIMVGYDFGYDIQKIKTPRYF